MKLDVSGVKYPLPLSQICNYGSQLQTFYVYNTAISSVISVPPNSFVGFLNTNLHIFQMERGKTLAHPLQWFPMIDYLYFLNLVI